MKKLICVLCLFSLVSFSPSSQGEVPPKVKVLLTTSAYGTVMGALLGAATLAFKAPGRAVAQGASLGLYAGIIFGSYVIVSHGQNNNPSYEQAPIENPDYQDDSPYSDNYYGGGLYKKKGHDVPLYINIAQFSF